LKKYKLNDAAFTYQKDSSVALGQGFPVRLSRLLHLEIVQERIEREYDLSIILSVPSVRYRLTLTDGNVVHIDNPAHYPDPSPLKKGKEPYIRATLLMPEKLPGAVIKLCMEKRGENSKLTTWDPVVLNWPMNMPLAEVIYDFYRSIQIHSPRDTGL